MTIQFMRYVHPKSCWEFDNITLPDEIEGMARQFRAIGGTFGTEYFDAYDQIVVYAELDGDDLVLELSENKEDDLAATFAKVIMKAQKLMVDRRVAKS